MKRSAPMVRSGFLRTRNPNRPPKIVDSVEESGEKQAAGGHPIKPLVRGTYAGGTTGPMPKPEMPRNADLLAMAQGRDCLFLAVTACRRLSFDNSTTVACHENEGKGMGLKSPDHRSVWGCIACHQWYDQSGAPRNEKRRAFAAAYVRQVEEWRQISLDPSQSVKDRKAAAWALEKLAPSLEQMGV